jgi:hypothetical protein
MAKRKKGQTTIYKTVHKVKGRVARTQLQTGGWIHVLCKGKLFLVH